MVNNSEIALDRVFYALSDPTRRAMLRDLAKKELNVSELAEPYDMSLAAVSKHLKVLESARFVEKKRDGRIFRCRANLAPLKDIYDLLDQLGAFWRSQLDSLEKFLEEETFTSKKGALWDKQHKQYKRRQK